VTRVVIIEPPPPQEVRQLAPPQPSPLPPPPEEPPVVFDDPSPIDTPAPPPAPPAPPAAQPDIAGGEVDASTRSQFPIQYPPAAMRSGITGTVIVQVTYDASGRITDATIFRSSRNRDLDRAALQGVRRWTVNPGRRGGQPVGGVANVTVDFTL
jgi:periplasmic protein TonB